ncbi:MAG: hypothetical protein DRN91_05170 [Candidatus Alkanophagales archaeon]|nr:MAG: hypothetical protein DRN91_05170 [Candidatus Alkanophagales archaeon]
MERDILLERLERKLAEKEKEVEELRRMLSSKTVEEIKKELREEFKRDLKSVEAKIAELSKSVETLMNEILFIKSEMKSRKKTEIVDIAKEEKREEEVEEEMIVVD